MWQLYVAIFIARVDGALQYEYTVDITGRNLELAELRPQIVSGVDDVSSF